MRRIVVLSCLLVAFFAAGVSASSAATRSWATPQIKAVVDAGLMAPSVAEFRPDDPLTAGELAIVLSTLGMSTAFVTDVNQMVSMRELDAQLVTAIGLRPHAREIRLAALGAGLTPRQWLGTETVARMLGLRLNHLKADEQLELQLAQPATRAEAAYSIARVLTISDLELEAVRLSLETFTFTELDQWQQAVLARALRLVGSPYVWAGTSERPQLLLGRQQPGGFDCSGFVWRVYKLELFPGAEALPAVLKGRTTYDMSGEVARAARIPRDSLEPGDLVFFGSRGRASKPVEVGHMGIYVGNGWMVHSSDRGTTLTPMTGWYETRFAWGRRPLAEAGLT
ncbi:MAG: C40 family peptidase [Actinobacteria bacterium]|nr:C40 family peptidase [Actinomycetota bacterium]